MSYDGELEADISPRRTGGRTGSECVIEKLTQRSRETYGTGQRHGRQRSHRSVKNLDAAETRLYSRCAEP